MYFLALQVQYWYDSVVSGTVRGVKPWDIVQDVNNIYLCLGKEVVFPELYTQNEYQFLAPRILIKEILSGKTMQLIHRMVQQYFSSYKTVVALFIPRNDTFVEKYTAYTKINQKKDWPLSQKCYIYPTLRTLTQQNPEVDTKKTAILHGGMSILQKQKLFSQIQNWDIQTLLATNRWLFFDWQRLEEIHIFDKDNRSYSSQSDPRFVISELAQKMIALYDAKLYL